MGLFGNKIDIKNASKTTYSEDDIKKLDLNYERDFVVRHDYTIFTPYRKEKPLALQTRMREAAFEKILDDHLFTFKYLLVVPNPYGVVSQSAMLLFNTSKLCKVRYRILGKNSDNDFCGETTYTHRHRVMVLGLYKGYTNKIKLELVDEQENVIKRRDLSIYSRDIDLSFLNLVTRSHQETSHFPFLLVNGVNFNPIVVDRQGEVRYALQLKTNKLGMIPLNNGHFLYTDTTVSRVSDDGHVSACQYHEMDYAGRVYRTFLFEYPIGRAIAQYGNSIFLVTNSSSDYDGDCIIELDQTSGKIQKTIDLAKIIGDKYKTQKNWATISSMEFVHTENLNNDVSEKTILLVLRRLHTILKLDWTKEKIVWMMAPKEIWQDTKYSECVLNMEPLTEGFYLMPEDVQYLGMTEGKEKYLIHSLENFGNLPVRQPDHSEQSQLSWCEIDVSQKICHVIHQYHTQKATRFASSYDPMDHAEDAHCLAFTGMLSERDENKQALIVEINKKTGEKTGSMQFCKTFRKAWPFVPDIAGYEIPLSFSMEQSTAEEVSNKNAKEDTRVILGHLDPPQKLKHDFPVAVDEKIKKGVIRNIRLKDTLFLLSFRPGTIQKVYLVSEKNAYLQDFSALKKASKRESFAIALNQLEYGEYHIIVEYKGKQHQLKNEIRIEPVSARNNSIDID